MSREEEDREKTLGTRERDVESGGKETTTTCTTNEKETGERPQKQQQQLDNTLNLFQNEIRWHRIVATGLIVTYFIEIILQVKISIILNTKLHRTVLQFNMRKNTQTNKSMTHYTLW